MKPTLEQYNLIKTCKNTSDTKDLIYAVKTTQIFCNFECNSKIPNIDNILIFKKSEIDKLKDYRECKRCKPLHEPEISIVEKVRNHIIKNNGNTSLEQCANNLGYNSSYLSRILSKNNFNFRKELKKWKK